jgi:pseudouridine-5'-phosphate glycosidase
MAVSARLHIHPEVAQAIRQGAPVVALESTLIAHGLPWPLNLETARAAEAAILAEGARPATIAVLDGRPTVGLNQVELEGLARCKDSVKASRRDLAAAVALRFTAATTVAATMALAAKAGIRMLATGGIGGAHRDSSHPWDISADIAELSRTPVAVVCAGAKSILDIPRTLELLETAGVPVLGFGTDEFPAFFLQSSGQRLTARVDSHQQAADLCRAHWDLGGAGVVIAQPVERHVALEPETFMEALSYAEREAVGEGVRGKELTPFLLSKLHEITEGQTLRANHSLVIANARLAAQVARAMCGV